MIGLLLVLSAVQGHLTGDVIWSRSDSPIAITGDVTVAPGATLTIEAGVEVRFEGDHSLIVQGTLDLRGTPDDEIVWVVNGRRVLSLGEPTIVTDRVERVEPADEGAAPILATGLSFDAVTGEIRYTLPGPGLVHAKIGVRDGGPLLRTLLDWEARSAGPHVERWNRRDNSGTVDFGTRDDLMLILSCRPERLGRTPAFDIAIDPVSVDGRLPIRVNVAPEDYRRLEQMRFETSIYVDAVFVTEHRQSDNPFELILDTTGLRPGEHVLTVNVIGFAGETATRSVRFVVPD